MRSCQHLAQSSNWRTTPYRLPATAYSIYSQLPAILEAVPPSATWGRAMPWWQRPTYHGRVGGRNKIKNYVALWISTGKKVTCKGHVGLSRNARVRYPSPSVQGEYPKCSCSHIGVEISFHPEIGEVILLDASFKIMLILPFLNDTRQFRVKEWQIKGDKCRYIIIYTVVIPLNHSGNFVPPLERLRALYFASTVCVFVCVSYDSSYSDIFLKLHCYL